MTIPSVRIEYLVCAEKLNDCLFAISTNSLFFTCFLKETILVVNAMILISMSRTDVNVVLKFIV